MADYMIKVVPTDPYYSMTEYEARKVVDFLKEKIKSDEVKVLLYETPVFIDCGSNLERISCPFCKSHLDFEWWGETMSAAGKKNFEDLSVKLPCCGRESMLNNLKYDFPCGFSCVEFDILNPAEKLSDDHLKHIQKLVGKPVRVIEARL